MGRKQLDKEEIWTTYFYTFSFIFSASYHVFQKHMFMNKQS